MNTFVNPIENGSAPDTQTTNGMGAMDQTEAWVKFDRIYGEQTPVDKVEMIED